MTRFKNELMLAKEAALQAGEVIYHYYESKNYTVEEKSEDHPVTIADKEANQIIRRKILNAFPRDAWLSEEDADDGLRLNRERVWIVDPLDGTKDFICGNPEFTVSIALVIDNQPVVGVIYNPVTKELFWAAKGQGTFLNDDERLTVLSHPGEKLIQVLASRSEHHRGEWEIYKNYFEIIPRGGAAYKMGLVAKGEGHACFTLKPKNEWDVCAGHLLVEEAGGVVTFVSGETVLYNQRNTSFQNLVYAHPEIHRQILQTIKKVEAA